MNRSFLSLFFYWSALCLGATITFLSNSAEAFFIGPVEIQAVDSGQAQLPSYTHEGEFYIMGRYHQRYMLRVINHSSERFELVITVDGRDVINGSAGKFSHRGYVLDPYHSFNVEGFRRSSSSVAAFRFTNPNDSYAGRMGAVENTGVIGVALFSERERPKQYPRYQYSERARSGGGYDVDELEARPMAEDSMAASEPSNSPATAEISRRKSSSPRGRRALPQKSELGTRYGESVHSEIEETEFVRRHSVPDQTLVITYDSESGLKRRGVIPVSRPVSKRPSAFPNESRFAPPPPGY